MRPEFDREQLERVVRRILGVDTAQVLHWEAAPLASGIGRPPLRVRGTAEVGGRMREWVCVVKSDDPDDAGPRLYRAGLLAGLPGPVRAPVIYHMQRVGTRDLIWMEYVEDRYGGDWPPGERNRAARAWGETQGRLLADRRDFSTVIPELDLGSWIAPLRAAAASEALWGLAPFADLARDGGRDELRRLDREWRGLQRALDAVPRTLCHGDFHAHNLCARPDGRFVALDWQWPAVGWLGYDVAGLAFGNFSATDAALVGAPGFDQHQHELLAAYADGVAAGGWTGDPRLLALGYCASLIWRCRIAQWRGPAESPRRESAFLQRVGGFDAATRTVCARTRIALAALDRAYRLVEGLSGTVAGA